MYRIMTAQSKRNNYGSLYQYMTTTIDDVVSPLEFSTKEALDTKIEKMLNEDGYAKDDFIIVEVVDYTIDATKYTDEETSTDTPTTGDSGSEAEGSSGQISE